MDIFITNLNCRKNMYFFLCTSYKEYPLLLFMHEKSTNVKHQVYQYVSTEHQVHRISTKYVKQEWRNKKCKNKSYNSSLYLIQYFIMPIDIHREWREFSAENVSQALIKQISIDFFFNSDICLGHGHLKYRLCLQ